MRRSWRSRALALLLGVWLVVLGIEPAALHVCPMHAPAHTPAHTPAHASGGHGPDARGPDAHAGHVAAGHAHASGGHASAARDGAAGGLVDPAEGAAGGGADPDAALCVCLGHCAGADLAVAAPARAEFVTALSPASARDTGLPDYAYVPVAAEHVLPFATAPPARPPA